jgi:Uma2 family endonuclease
MSATIAPPISPLPPPVPRPLTVADIAALPDELPSGPVKYELDDGRLVIMAPPGGIHGRMAARMVGHLLVHGESAGHGDAYSDVAIVLRRNPDRLVAPDACFVANTSLPVKHSTEGYLETIPELVVEVRSKNDTLAELERKAGEYLAAGTKLVWVIDPIRSVAVVYEAGHPPRTLGPAEELTAEGIIPGFRLAVGEALRV